MATPRLLVDARRPDLAPRQPVPGDARPHIRLQALAQQHQLGGLLRILTLEPVDVPDGESRVRTVSDWLPDSAGTLREDDGEMDDLATIVYTSGTTGIPKGAVLTHDNITFTAQSVFGSAKIFADDNAMLFLPLAHIFARTCVFTALFAGCNTTFARSIETIGDDFKIARPHWFPSVPRIYEKVHTKIISGAQAKGGVALKLFNWACGVGAQVSDLKVAKKPIPTLLNLKYGLATKLVFSKLHAKLGGRLQFAISGGAPLAPEIANFLNAAGLTVFFLVAGSLLSGMLVMRARVQAARADAAEKLGLAQLSHSPVLD